MDRVGAPMKRARAALATLAIAMAFAACKVGAGKWIRAGKEPYFYAPIELDAGAIPRGAGVPPSLELVGGKPGARGDLDGIGAGARIGLVGGMVRVGDAILFADEGNGSIRRFHPKTNAVETLARLPSAGRPPMPAFIAYDGRTHAYATDRSGQVVYAFDIDTNALTAIAGTLGVRGDTDGAKALFDAPTGIAFLNDALYVADTGTRHIRKIDLATKIVSTLAPNFLQVWGLCTDGTSLFATDDLSEAIFRIDAGVSTVLAGSNRFGYAGPTDGKASAARFREPRGIGCFGDHLLVAHRGNDLVRRVDAGSFAVSTVAGRAAESGLRDGRAEQALFADVQSVLEWDDDIYIGDDSTLRVFSKRDSMVRTVAGISDRTDVWTLTAPDTLPRPTGVAVVGNSAYVATCGRDVARVDLSTGTSTPFAGDRVARSAFKDGTGFDAHFSCVSAITTDGRGNLFVGDSGNHAVRGIRIDTRDVLTIAGTPSRCGNDDGDFDDATFCDPEGLAFGGGRLFVADASTHTIRAIDFATRSISTIAGTQFTCGHQDGPASFARFCAPSGLAYREPNLFVADRENHVVRQIDLNTRMVTTIAGTIKQAGATETTLDRPTGVALRGGDLLVVDRSSVGRIAAGRITRLVVGGRALRIGANPMVSQPAAIADVGEGDALVVDRQENVLVRLRY